MNLVAQYDVVETKLTQNARKIHISAKERAENFPLLKSKSTKKSKTSRANKNISKQNSKNNQLPKNAAMHK